MDNRGNGISVEQAMKLAQSLAGQELIRLLQQVAPQSVEAAQALSGEGKNTEACDALKDAVNNPQVREALRKLKL